MQTHDMRESNYWICARIPNLNICICCQDGILHCMKRLACNSFLFSLFSLFHTCSQIYTIQRFLWYKNKLKQLINVCVDAPYMKASNDSEFDKLSVLIKMNIDYLFHHKVRTSLNIFGHELLLGNKFHFFRSKTYPL